MSKIFNHTVQKIGSTTSPVEDLALEVADAFSLLEDKLSTNPNIIPTFKEVIGDLTLESLRQHKVSKTESEVHNILPGENSIVLENIPNDGTTAITYFNNATHATVPLTKVDSQAEFTDKNQYKINGKVILLNINVPGAGSVPVTVTYSTTTFPFGGKKLLPNVLKDVNGHWTLEPKHLTDNKYIIDFGKNISDNLDEYKKDSNAKFKFYVSQNKSEWQELTVNNYEVKGNLITVEADNLNLVPGQTSIATFVANTTIAELLNSLYEEFVRHNHSSDSLTKNIAIQDIINRYSNGKISYKSGDIVNYSFPQYLNREGHNPNLDAVYENSLLGNLFVSRKLSPEGTKYKGLDEDSNAVIFGEPSLGHRFRYDKTAQALTLNSVESLNGLKIINNHLNKYTLALNGTEIQSTRDKVTLKPEGGLLDVSSPDANKYSIKTDNLEVTENSVFKDANFKSFRLNNIKFHVHDNTVDAKIVPVGNVAGDIPKLEIKVKTEIDDLTVRDLNMVNATFKSFSLGGIRGVEDKVGNFTFSSDKLLKFENPVFTKDLGSDRVKIGDVVLSKNDQDPNNGLVVISTKPDSDIQFKSDVVFANTNTTKAVSRRSLIDNLEIGAIKLSKNVDEDLEVSTDTPGKKVVFKAPVEFKNITTGASSSVTLATITSDQLTIGNHRIVKEDDNTIIRPVDTNKVDSTLIINSQAHLKKAEIDGGNINSIKVGSSTITTKNNNAHIKPDDERLSKLHIDTEAHVRKLVGEEVNAKALQSSNAILDGIHVGDLTVSKTADNNMEVTGKATSNTLTVKVPTTLENATIKSIHVVEGALQNTSVAEKLSVGNVEFGKEVGTDDLKVVGKNDTTKAKFELPTEFKKIVVEDLETTNKTSLTGLEIKTLDLHGFVFKKNDNDDNLNIAHKDPTRTIEFDSPVQASKFFASNLSILNYKLSNGDKISIDDENYITNNNGKFSAKLTKGIVLAPSGQGTGLSMSLKEDSTPVLNQFISANSGAPGVESEKNLFIETNVTSGTYFLKPTHTRVTKNNVVIGFNDATAQRNITDLTKWFRSDIFVGNVTSETLTAGVNEPGQKKGLKIGSTRISVIGPGTNCPEGLTTLESTDSVHIIQPTGDTDACRNLTYQKVNTGSLAVFGDTTVEGSGTFTEDLLVNNTIATKDLAVTGDAELNNVVVPESLTVAGKASFGSSVEFKNDLKLSNDLVSEARIIARSIEADKNSIFKENLEVEGKVNIDKSIAVGENLNVKGNITSDSLIRSSGLQTLDIRAQDVISTGYMKTTGTLEVGSRATFQNDMVIHGNVEINSKVELKDDLVVEQLYTISTADIRGKLTALSDFEARGKNVQIGSENSLVQISGKLQFETNEVNYNSPVKIYDKLKVADDAEITGSVTIKGDTIAKGPIFLDGPVNVAANATFKGELLGKSLSLTNGIKADGAIVADSLTVNSIAVDKIATISNLSITQSLSMALSTEVVGGKAKFNELTTINPSAENNIAGSLSVSGKCNLFNVVDFSQNAIFGGGDLVINGSGVKGPSATVDVETVKAKELVGTYKVNAPSHVLTSNNRTVQQISASIPSRNFVQIDNFVSDGVAVFNQPLIADTIVFKSLEFVGESHDSRSGELGIDIVARRAVYA